jgi:hypothetical protein
MSRWQPSAPFTPLCPRPAASCTASTAARTHSARSTVLSTFLGEMGTMEMQAHELWSTTRCTRPKLPFTRAQTMAPFMLKHDGKLNRWCSVQEDVEDYFRKTLGEVRAACLRTSSLVLLVHMGRMLNAAVLPMRL